MNVPIKMIGIAAAFFWLFLIGFSVSAALSLKDLQFSFGEPQIVSNPNGELQFMLPISIGNTGGFNIHAFNMTTTIGGSDGGTIARGSTFIETINPGQTISTTHMFTVNLRDLFLNNQNLIFNDSTISLDEHVGMTLAELIPVSVETNSSVPWGAPLSNFTIERPQFSPYNATYATAIVPFSFQNHAPFDLAGEIQLRMYGSAGTLAAQVQTDFGTPQNSPCEGYFSLVLPTSSVSPSGHFEADISTPMFNYGPVVMPYG
jgi:hypothetical protein